MYIPPSSVFWRGRYYRFHGGADDAAGAQSDQASDSATADQASANQSGQQGTGGQQQTGSDGTAYDPTRAANTIATLRSEIKALKAQAAEGATAKQRLQEIEDANKSDLEKAQAKAAELEQKLAEAQVAHREALVRAAIEREAAKQEAVDPSDVYALMDRSSLEIEDGEVIGVDKAVEALLKAKPHLKKQPTAGAQGVPGTPRANGQAPTREQRVDEMNKRLAASGRYGRL